MTVRFPVDYHTLWLAWGNMGPEDEIHMLQHGTETGLGDHWYTVTTGIASGDIDVHVSTGAEPSDWLALPWTHHAEAQARHVGGDLSLFAMEVSPDSLLPLDLTVPPGDHTITLRQFTVPEEYDGHGMNDTAERAWLHIGSPH